MLVIANNPTIHKIDPRADTIIVLKHPQTEFAVWEETPVSNNVATATSGNPPGNASSGNDLGVQSHAQHTTSTTLIGPAPQDQAAENATSHHLRLASRVFDSMLSRWKEAKPNPADGYLYISASDWDADAFLILLNVLHSRTRQVPRSVSLEELAKIAVLVDYYECEEVVELYAERWYTKLKEKTPVRLVLNRVLILWMCVAWVFKFPSEFTLATLIAMMRSTRKELRTLGLPITSFVDKIDSARLTTISSIINGLNKLREEYHSPQYRCPSRADLSFQCGSILYGALVRQMDDTVPVPLPPEQPYPGLSVHELRIKLRQMKNPDWHVTRIGYPYGEFDLHACKLDKSVHQILDSVPDLQGLKLGDFTRAA